MKPECDAIRPLLGAFADQELDAGQADRVRQHLETCPDCTCELAQIEHLHKLVKSVPHPELAEDYWHWQRQRVWRGVRDQRREMMPRFRPSFMWTKLATVTAGAAVVLVIVIAGWRMFGERQFISGEGVAGGHAKVEQPVATAAEKEPETPTREQEDLAADASRDEAEVSARGGAGTETRTAGERDKAKTGYAGKGAEPAALGRATTGGVVAKRAAIARQGVAKDELRALPAPPPAAEEKARWDADYCATVPALLESPPLPELDILDTGTVLLNLVTDSNGLVVNAVVSQTSGSVLLDSIALLQIRQSRFRAVLKNNRQVPCSFEYPYRFQKQQKQN